MKVKTDVKAGGIFSFLKPIGDSSTWW